MSQGRYSIQEIETRSQVPVGTLRQWERRYGFPKPERTESGRRLFSEADLAAIVTMKAYIDTGIPPSRAVELVKQGAPALAATGASQVLKQQLVEAFLALDETKVNHILSQAFALHPLDVVLMDIIQASIVELGQRWHDGEIDIATEHFASNIAQAKLRNLLTVFAEGATGPTVIVSCAPLEMHELGVLIVAVLLRQAGYRVYYLGADTPLSDLREIAMKLQPAAVLISATTSRALAELKATKTHLKNIAPTLVFGGRAFMVEPAAAKTLGGQLLSPQVKLAIKQLSQLIKTQYSPRPVTTNPLLGLAGLSGKWHEDRSASQFGLIIRAEGHWPD